MAQRDEAGGVVRKGTLQIRPLRRHTLKVSFQLVDLLALPAVEAPEVSDLVLAFSRVSARDLRWLPLLFSSRGFNSSSSISVDA